MTALGGAGVWAHAAVYERYIGRWSRPVAVEFVRWLDEPPAMRWVDMGCGTGAVTKALLEEAAPAFVTCVDQSQAYLDFTRAQLGADERLTFTLGDAAALPLPDRAFDVAVCGLVLNFVTDAGRALAELARVVRPGGRVAGYVWDYADGMQFLRYFWDAAIEVDPAAADRDEARRSPLCRPPRLEDTFRRVPLDEVVVRPIVADTVFASFDDYWEPFLGGQGTVGSYLVSLDADHRRALRARLRARLPIGLDGRISLVARAWAVRGRRPA